MRLSIATFYPANTANYTKGRQGNSVDRITVHHTAGFESSLKALYENPQRQGSAHFFVHPTKIEQYVDTNDTAWTNGNFSSNLRAITIEVRGDWRGYYDQATLDSLKRLFSELRKHYPNARLTYHMDESDKATACPADLKNKWYALRVWNESLTQGAEMFNNDTEVKEAYMLLRGNEGSAGERAGWINQSKQAFFKVALAEANGYRQQLADVRQALLNEQAKPAKEIIKEVITIVEKPVEVIKIQEIPVEVIKEVEKPVTWSKVADFFRDLINKFLRKS